MAGTVTIHIADVGFPSSLAIVRKPPVADGLVHADLGLAAPLGASLLPRPQIGRVALFAYWEDREAADRFATSHPLGERLAGGWRVTLEPLRRFGDWPGVPPSVPTSRSVPHDGPAVVLTLGRLRLPRTVAFLRASARAEASALASPGLVWATGVARPPFVATCSLWDSSAALATYAYGTRDPGHPDAVAAADANPFHHRSAFVRFEPVDVAGSLGGRNPLPANALAAAATRSGHGTLEG